MTHKEEPEKLFDMLEYDCWPSKDEMIKDITDKLRELGYSTKEHIDPDVINIICEHGKICRVLLLHKDKSEGEYPWSINDICDYDSIPNRCQTCRKRKTIEYMFDGDALKFWNKDSPNKFDEIDLNDLIDWDKVNSKALEEMKEKFPKSTTFVDIDK